MWAEFQRYTDLKNRKLQYRIAICNSLEIFVKQCRSAKGKRGKGNWSDRTFQKRESSILEFHLHTIQRLHSRWNIQHVQDNRLVWPQHDSACDHRHQSISNLPCSAMKFEDFHQLLFAGSLQREQQQKGFRNSLRAVGHVTLLFVLNIVDDDDRSPMHPFSRSVVVKGRMCSLIYITTTLGKGSGKFEIRNKQASEIEEKQRSKCKDSLFHKHLMDLSEPLRDFRNGNGPSWKCLKASEIWRSDLSDKIDLLVATLRRTFARKKTNKQAPGIL